MKKRRGGTLSARRVREILRLWELEQNKTEIGRAVGVSRVTVRDYVSRAKSLGIGYQEASKLTEEELHERFEKSSPGRRIKDTAVNFSKINEELSQKGVTRLLLWEEYLRDHPEGYSYTQFCSRFKAWQKSHKLSLRRTYRAGEFMEVDYAGHKIAIVCRETGEVKEAEIFVSVLPLSNKIFTEATPSQSLPCWLGSHVRAFEYYGGLPEVVVPDNLKSGVKKACFYDPELNPSYRDLAEHYDLAVLPARVRKPRDKAKVENAVQQVERRILAQLRNQTFYSVAELNLVITPLLAELNARQMKNYQASREELFEKLEKDVLRPLPSHPYRFSEWKRAKVNIDYHVEIKRHYYSVPYQYVHKKLEVRIGEKTVEVFLEQERVAFHPRSNLPGRHTTNPEHMPKEHRYLQEWTPTRFLSWAEKIGRETKIQVNSILHSRKHPEQGYRACLGLLTLGKKHGNHRLEAACEKANSLSIVSFKSIKSMLDTGNEKKHKQQQNTVIHHHGNIRGDTEFH